MDVLPQKALEIRLGGFLPFLFHSHNKAENAAGCVGRFETKKGDYKANLGSSCVHADSIRLKIIPVAFSPVFRLVVPQKYSQVIKL